MLARLDGAERVVDAHDRVAGGLNDDVQFGVEQDGRVGHDGGGPRGDSRLDVVDEGFLGPVDQLQGALGAFGVDIGDGDDVDAGDVAGLCQVHRAEPSGTDQPHADRAALGLALGQKFVQVHNYLSVGAAPSRVDRRAEKSWGPPQRLR